MDLMEILVSFNNVAQIANARSATEMNPNIQWNTQLRPYDSYNTSYSPTGKRLAGLSAFVEHENGKSRGV